MSLSVNQLDEVRAYLGTMHYISKKARENHLYFVESIVLKSMLTIEDVLKNGEVSESAPEMTNSDLMNVIRFTDLLAKAPDNVLQAFIDQVQEGDEAATSHVKNTTATH